MAVVSVCLAVYDSIDTVSQAIDSAIFQDFEDKEIILYCDGCTDGTDQLIVDRYSHVPSLSVYTSAVNRGIGFSRNFLLQKAQGEFIAFFDTDDVSSERRLSVQYEYFNLITQNLPKVVVFAGCDRFYPNGKVVSTQSIGSGLKVDGIPASSSFLDKYMLGNRSSGPMWGDGASTKSMFARKEDLIDVGGFDPNLRRLEDFDICVRLALDGFRFCGPEPTLIQQTVTKNTTKAPRQNHKYFEAVLKKHQGRFTSREYRWASALNKIRLLYFERKLAKLTLVVITMSVLHPINVFYRVSALFSRIKVDH